MDGWKPTRACRSALSEEAKIAEDLEIDTVGLFPTPSAINELDNNQKSNINGIFDILGKEWKTNFADLPKGVYIVNGRKVFKTK